MRSQKIADIGIRLDDRYLGNARGYTGIDMNINEEKMPECIDTVQNLKIRCM